MFPERRGRVNEGEVCLDHVYILVSIPPRYSVGSFMGYFSGKEPQKIQLYIKKQLKEDARLLYEED